MNEVASLELGRKIDLIIAHAEQAAIDDKGMFSSMDNNPMNRQTIFNETMQLIKHEVNRQAQEPLKRLLAHSRETKDVKNGQVLQTIGKGWIFQEIDALKNQTNQPTGRKENN